MTELAWLSQDNLLFPPLEEALEEPSGLIAAGGDLSVERLIAAYRSGIFPWFEEDQPILWWSPSPRSVLYPEDVHISKSLRKRMRKGEYRVSADKAFEQVIFNCKNTREFTQGTWITDDMLYAYNQLHAKGIAHSVEVWFDDQLAGGLYGIAIGCLFFGESMFSLKTDASKIAFVTLAQTLAQCGFKLIDCQVPNPHLESLGSCEIGRESFQQYLAENLDKSPLSDPWESININTGNKSD